MPDSRQTCSPRTLLSLASRRLTWAARAGCAGVGGEQVGLQGGPADGGPAAAGTVWGSAA
ncbi:hypothetical protein DQ384_38725 [Sphaerisporangium album]|uniref:Uncharacterized protein n=1 Tax=Sphaerisporangium album TaxID=509200 RepID=A0A367EN97_9ACTN|nr:hypothetical protein DQ384_38725 [Sphaerisporangium album]